MIRFDHIGLHYQSQNKEEFFWWTSFRWNELTTFDFVEIEPHSYLIRTLFVCLLLIRYEILFYSQIYSERIWIWIQFDKNLLRFVQLIHMLHYTSIVKRKSLFNLNISFVSILKQSQHVAHLKLMCLLENFNLSPVSKSFLTFKWNVLHSTCNR